MGRHPTTEELDSATLDVTEASGASHRTTFTGNVTGTAAPPPPAGQAGAAIGGGSTLFAYDSDRGDYIGEGREASYDAGDGEFRVFGSSHLVRGLHEPEQRRGVVGRVPASRGDILVPGYSYSGATRYPFNHDEAGLSVSGAGRGCNTLYGTFAIHALRVNDFGDLREFHATFEQHCDDEVPALRGTFRCSTRARFHLAPVRGTSTRSRPQTHPRTVTLSIKNQVARGAVKMETTVRECRVGVRVRLQRRVDGRFRTVAEVVTDNIARYEQWVGRTHGVYRAVAPAKQLVTGDTCARPCRRPGGTDRAYEDRCSVGQSVRGPDHRRGHARRVIRGRSLLVPRDLRDHGRRAPGLHHPGHDSLLPLRELRDRGPARAEASSCTQVPGPTGRSSRSSSRHPGRTPQGRCVHGGGAVRRPGDTGDRHHGGPPRLQHDERPLRDSRTCSSPRAAWRGSGCCSSRVATPAQVAAARR